MREVESPAFSLPSLLHNSKSKYSGNVVACLKKKLMYCCQTQRHFIMVECSPNFYLCLSGLIENVVTLRDEFSHWSAFCGCKLVELNTVIASCYNVLLEVAPA